MIFCVDYYEFTFSGYCSAYETFDAFNCIVKFYLVYCEDGVECLM